MFINNSRVLFNWKTMNISKIKSRKTGKFRQNRIENSPTSSTCSSRSEEERSNVEKTTGNAVEVIKMREIKKPEFAFEFSGMERSNSPEEALIELSKPQKVEVCKNFAEKPETFMENQTIITTHHSIRPMYLWENYGEIQYKFPKPPAVELEKVSIQNKWEILDVYLEKIEFFYHPIFSVENVLEKQMKQAVYKYKTVKSPKTIRQIMKKYRHLNEALEIWKILRKSQSTTCRLIIKTYPNVKYPEMNLDMSKSQLEMYQNVMEIDLDCINLPRSNLEQNNSIEFSIEIYYQSLLVCKSRKFPLEQPEFVVEINQIFSIQFMPGLTGQELEFSIIQHQPKEEVAKIRIKIPGKRVKSTKKDSAESFVNTQHRHYPGSLPGFLDADEGFHTNGVLVCSVEWQKSGYVDQSEDAGPTSMVVEDGQTQENVDFRWPAFCSDEAIRSNIRFELLRLRNDHVIEFDGQLVPNRIREIPVAVIREFKKRRQQIILTNKTDVEKEDSDVETRRQKGRSRLILTYKTVFYMCKGMTDSLTYDSVIDEKYLLYFQEFVRISLRNFLRNFQWRPQQFQRLPERKNSREIDNPDQVNNNNLLRIYLLSGLTGGECLEIEFDGTCGRIQKTGNDVTTIEQIEFPLRKIYQEYENFDSLFHTQIQFRLYGSFMEFNGEFTIDLPAVTTSGTNFIGTYQINPPKPAFHLAELPSRNVKIQTEIRRNFPRLQVNFQNFPTNEPTLLKNHLIGWSDWFNQQFPNKRFSVFAVDGSSGKSNCLIRYLQPLEPPHGLYNNQESNQTVHQLLRYVHLIPFQDFGGSELSRMIWQMPEEFLRNQCGHQYDHSVLLTTYLLGLNMDAYLCLGFGVTGVASWVLVRDRQDSNQMTGLDVLTNRQFDTQEIQNVYCLINSKNIFGCLQTTQPMRFDLDRQSDWSKLFQSPTDKSNGIWNRQPIMKRSRIDKHQLEIELERSLRRKFAKFRPSQPTKFNKSFVEQIKQGLDMLEIVEMSVSNSGLMDRLKGLDNLLKDQNISGLILNCHFDSVKNLAKKIKATKWHLQENVKEFVLRISVTHYPADVVSIWIYIGACF